MGVIPKKSLGQNFLMHTQTAHRIAKAAALPPRATVLEIGPGTGMLTEALLQAVAPHGGRVVAVETDESLIPILEEKFSTEIATSQLFLQHGDIRTLDLSSVPGDETGEYHVVANIPYYITGDIIRMLLEAERKPASITILVQKEVAERIARANGKESVLSIAVAAYGVPTYCFTVPRGAFKPAPNVDSAVLRISSINQHAFVSQVEEKEFFTLVKAGFAHKRKKLIKNLEEILSPHTLAQAFAKASINPDTRAETLSIKDWRALFAATRQVAE